MATGYARIYLIYGIRAEICDENNEIQSYIRADYVYVKNIEIYYPFSVRIPHMRKKRKLSVLAWLFLLGFVNPCYVL
jgi:hypothetical protein